MPFRGQQWVGLVRCWLHNETKTTQEEWAPCNEDRQPEVNAGNRSCTCDPHSPYGAVITAGIDLSATATLPPQRGLHLDYVQGKTPQVVLQYISKYGSYTTPDSAGTPATSSAIRTTTNRPSTLQQGGNTSSSYHVVVGTPVTMPSASASETCSHGGAPDCTSSPMITPSMDLGTKIGVSVGSILGGIAFAALFLYLVIRHRRRTQTQARQHNESILDAAAAVLRGSSKPMVPSTAELPELADEPRQAPDSASPLPITMTHTSEVPVLTGDLYGTRETMRQSIVSANTNMGGMVASPSAISSASSLSPLQRHFNSSSSHPGHISYHELPIVPEREQIHELDPANKTEPLHITQAVTSQDSREARTIMGGQKLSGWQYQAYRPEPDGLNALNDGYATGYETGGKQGETR